MARRPYRNVAALCLALLLTLPLPAMAAGSGVVVASSGSKDSVRFAEWQEFRRNVDDRSSGSLLLDYLIFGELGSAQSMLQAVMTGRASIGGFGCGGITAAIPELAVPQMPFLFASREEADFVFDRFLTPIYSDILGSHGLVLLRWTDFGFMELYSREPVRSPFQLAGRSVRTVGNISGPEMLKAVRAIPVEVGIGEIADSSQSNKLFGSVGTLQNYERVQSTFPYVTNTEHSYNCGVIVANKGWFDSLAPQERDILRASYPKIADMRGALQAEEMSLRIRLETKGSVFLALSAEEHNAWAAAALPLYPTILKQAGGRAVEIYDLIRAGKQAFLREPASSPFH